MCFPCDIYVTKARLLPGCDVSRPLGPQAKEDGDVPKSPEQRKAIASELKVRRIARRVNRRVNLVGIAGLGTRRRTLQSPKLNCGAISSPSRPDY